MEYFKKFCKIIILIYIFHNILVHIITYVSNKYTDNEIIRDNPYFKQIAKNIKHFDEKLLSELIPLLTCDYDLNDRSYFYVMTGPNGELTAKYHAYLLKLNSKK